MDERIVITGMGAVSCLGPDVDAFWRGLIGARSGIGPVHRFDTSALRSPEAGEVDPSFEARLPDEATHLDRAAQFAVIAAREAVRRAGIVDPDRRRGLGVVLATNFGGPASFERWASGVLGGNRDPAMLDRALPQSAALAVARSLGAGGPRATLSLSCSSGAAAIGLAASWIRAGRARQVLAGGYDALSLYCLAGLSCLRTVTTEKLRPFDRRRSGTVFGEGAGMLVLETERSARERGARPEAILRGWYCNNNAHHLTAPDPDGAGLLSVMQGACEDASTPPESIDTVNAHGTGTRYNDAAETAALHRLFGARAPRVPVSAIKAAISHTMGAAGALEAIATAISLREGILPPTLNWEERDPDCDLDYVPNEARPHRTQRALSVSSGLGGNNAALVLERYD